MKKQLFKLLSLALAFMLLLSGCGSWDNYIVEGSRRPDKKLSQDENLPSEDKIIDDDGRDDSLGNLNKTDISPDADNTNEEKTEEPEVFRYEFTTAPEGFFDDALFIGDSRSVGLRNYGELEGGCWFVSTGLSIYNVHEKTVKVENLGNVNLQEVLDAGLYKNVYVGLGINEIGYDIDITVNKFNDFLFFLQQACPGCTLYILGNLHVTAALSNSDKVYNNERIDLLNSKLAGLADDINIFYLDGNHLFDDENGNMLQQYSSDNTHLYAKYYNLWAGYIKDHVIVR